MNILKITMTVSAILLPTLVCAQSVVINQNSNVNVAAIVQAGPNNSPVTIVQNGDFNFSGVVQAGNNNYANISQTGTFSTTAIGQLGYYNGFVLSQYFR